MPQDRSVAPTATRPLQPCLLPTVMAADYMILNTGPARGMEGIYTVCSTTNATAYRSTVNVAGSEFVLQLYAFGDATYIAKQFTAMEVRPHIAEGIRCVLADYSDIWSELAKY